MQPIFFSTAAEFRGWLEANHDRETELLVGFYTKSTGRTSLAVAEAVDEALCFGWIDGVKRTHAPGSYTYRFSPRRRRSVWSRANVLRFEELVRAGRVTPAGARAYEARDPERSGQDLRAQRARARLAPEAETRFRENADAWRFFQSQPPGYRTLATAWVVEAKREETRQRRLDTLIADSAAGRRIAPLRRAGEGT